MGESVTIRTGKMGHGKTLNAIREIDAQAKAENRIVYYHNIDGLQSDKLQAQWYEFGDPHKWYELPEHAIIVIDEAADYFPTRDPRAEAPEYIKRLRYIRHAGHEIVFIVQDHRFLDIDIRRLCGCHIHFKRILGSTKLARYEFFECFDYDKAAALKEVDKKYIKLDKNIFGVYKSASSHHFKIKIPKKFYLFLVLVVIAGYLLFYVFSGISAKAQPAEETASNQDKQTASKGLMGTVVDNVTSSAGLSNEDRKDRPMTTEEYLAHYKPRIEDLPHTAPAYDKLTEPQSYPRLSCMVTKSQQFIDSNKEKIALGYYNKKWLGCACYTQQATVYKISFNACMNIVENGYFDAAKPDRGTRRNEDKGNNDLFDRLAKK